MKTSWIATAVVALGLLVWLISTGVDGGTVASATVRHSWSAPPPASVTTSPARIDTDLDPACDEPSRTAVTAGSLREEITASPVVITRGSSAIAHASVGKLLVRAVDATTNEPLRSFGVRLMSDARFADERTHDASGEIELPLTAGIYSLAISSSGYESVEVAQATVTAGETNRLEPARLRAGAGVIVAEVMGVPRDRPNFAVELIGIGRRPCERCGDVDDPNASIDAGEVDVHRWGRAAPCSFCGFSRDRSRVLLASGQCAEFRGLASGNYALRVRDDRNLVVCEDRELSLRDTGIERVTFELSRQRYVEVEFLDVDEQSLSNEWGRRLADAEGEQEEEIVLSFEGGLRMNPITLAFSDDTNTLAATAVVMPPIPRGTTALGVGWSSHSTRGAGLRRASVDRARQPEDLLWPEPAPARFDTPEIACDIDDNGLVRVGPLPSSRLTLRATAENFAAEALVPESRVDTRVTLRLRSTVPDSNATAELATYSRYELRELK